MHYKDYMSKVLLIQRFIKSRFALKFKTAIMIQKFMKGRPIVFKYRELIKIKRANQKIE